jgi:hypothetical protein
VNHSHLRPERKSVLAEVDQLVAEILASGERDDQATADDRLTFPSGPVLGEFLTFKRRRMPESMDQIGSYKKPVRGDANRSMMRI